MAKCKCSSRPRIVSPMAQFDGANGCKCKHKDVCANPICGEPNKLSIFAPLIYDEIGINLCTTFDITPDIGETYPNVTSATVQVIDATYSYGPDNVQIEAINGRPNCYLVRLSNITIRFAVRLYDSSCRLITTLFPEVLYLPPTTDPGYDEDTNPSSVELEIFAPYGVAYTVLDDDTVRADVNFLAFSGLNNHIAQGVNMFGYAKMLDLDVENSTATVGLTLVLQSLYYASYKVESAGKIRTPKGSIISNENSDCMRFVAGDLLNLAIKPLDLGKPYYEETLKDDEENEHPCGGDCNTGAVAQSGVSLNPPVTPQTP